VKLLLVTKYISYFNYIFFLIIIPIAGIPIDKVNTIPKPSKIIPLIENKVVNINLK
jgi:hypothetical protein